MNEKEIFKHLYEMEVWLALASGLSKPDIKKSWDSFIKQCAKSYGITIAEMKQEAGEMPQIPADFPITKKMEKFDRGFYIQLSSSANPDHMHTASGREEQKGKIIKKHYYKINSEKEGTAIVLKFKELFELGGGNFPNAPLFWAKNLRQVGEFSYNGKFWKKQG